MTAKAPHTLIRASAGSGKTFQLAHRYLKLLAQGVRPESILAVTFSRKAAGEIFQNVMGYLIDAATDEKTASLTAERIGQPGLQTTDFQQLLAVYIQNLHRVRVGTLDSFFTSLLRTFSLELGVSPYLRLVDTGSDEAVRLHRSALDRLTLRTARDQEVLRDLESAFKQATMGREDSRFLELFLGFLNEALWLYRMKPEATVWGDPDTLWPQGIPWDWDASLLKHLDALQEEIQDITDKASALDYLNRLDAVVRSYRRGAPWDEECAKVMEKFLPCLHQEDPLTLKLGRANATFTTVQADRLRRITASMVRGALEHVMDVTAGVHALIDRFHDVYLSAMREQGRLTFDDELYVLDPQTGTARPFSSERRADRLYIDFRMDGRIDHWLLDEFQDTSTLQYRILANLLDEVIQHAEGRRSLFVVGDVKQSIYGWRGGEFGLMDRLIEQYGSAIQQVPMDETRRSCPAVLDLVNTVCTNIDTETGTLREAEAYWNRLWGEHRSAGAAADQSGFAVMLEPEWVDEKTPPGESEVFEAMLEVLLSVRPWERGLSTAILAYTNRQTADLAVYLREHCPEAAVRLQGDVQANREILFNLLVSLVQWIAHPGDRAAEQHLRMSPLGARWPEDLSTIHSEYLTQISRRGLHSVLFTAGSDWLDSHPEETSRHRWRELLRLAESYERDPDMTLDEFIQEARGHRVSQSAQGGGIYLMTIHQSKGLGFDLVLWLAKGTRSMDAVRGSMVISHPLGVSNPDWLLQSPDRSVLEVDPILSAASQTQRSAAFYESLCMMYVAMTRARRGLYIFPVRSGRTASSLSTGNFLLQAVTGDLNTRTEETCCLHKQKLHPFFRSGDPEWYKGCEPQAPVPAPTLERPQELGARGSVLPMLKRRNPSSQSDEKESAATLFQPGLEDSLLFGTAFHEYMESFQWLEEVSDESSKAWKIGCGWPEDLADRVLAESRIAFQHSAFASALKRPEQALSEVWQEAKFETVLNHEWITGTFDRVMIVRDAEGRVQEAAILDFKTNQIRSKDDLHRWQEHYAPQMNLYRIVLADMLRIPPETIRCRLLFSKTGDVVEI